MISRGGAPPPGRIAVLHGLRDRAEALARVLRAAGHTVTVVSQGSGAEQELIECRPDLMVGSLTFQVPPLPVLLRDTAPSLKPGTPLLVVAGREDQDVDFETDDVIREPVEARELALRVAQMLKTGQERDLLRRKLDEQVALYRASWAFSVAAGAESLYGQLARQSAELLRARKGLLLLYDRDRREMIGQAPAHGFTPEQVRAARYAVDAEARSLWHFRTNGPLLSNRAGTDSRLLPGVVPALGAQSLVVVPLPHGSQVLGLLLAADRIDGEPFRESDLTLLQAVAGHAGVALENHRLHVRLQDANTRLQEYDRLKSEFVAMVAHDFRRPLTAIRGFAELMLEDADLSLDSRQEFLSTIISETDSLARLAGDTLLISQIEAGKFQFNFSEFEVGPFLLEAVPLGLSDHSVLVDVPREPIRLAGDRDRLRHVIINLTSNAVKYSPGGGAIQVRCRRRGPEHLVIEVEDHGLGIPRDQLGRLFQKFERVRTDEHLKIAGTGLGLYICRLTVQGHGGQIWVESEPGQGSTFGVLLPLDARAAVARSSAESEFFPITPITPTSAGPA